MTIPLPEDRLRELREALAKATPGPWTRFHDKTQPHPCHCGQIWGGDDLLFIPANDPDDEPAERVEDGRLIVLLRNSADALIASHDAMARELAALRESLEAALQRAQCRRGMNQQELRGLLWGIEEIAKKALTPQPDAQASAKEERRDRPQ